MASSSPPPVVVGVDASRNAVTAAEWAAAEAATRGRGLRVVHAWRAAPAQWASAPVAYIEVMRAARREAERLVSGIAEWIRDTHRGLSVTSALIEEDPAEALVRVGRDAELLVLGTRGHGGFAGMLIGSVSLKLAAHSPSPVVMVHGSDDTSRTGREIILGVEKDEPAAPISFAFTAARNLGVDVRAVHAWRFPSGYSGLCSELGLITQSYADAEAKVLEDAISEARTRFPRVTVHTETSCASPAAVLCEASRNAHMVVVGAHRRRGPLSIGVGSVVRALMAHGSCPVAVVPVP